MSRSKISVMSSYLEVLSSVDSEVISSIGTTELIRLVVLFSTEYAKRRPVSPITWLKEWRDKNRSRKIRYVISPNQGVIQIKNEVGAAYSTTVEREPLIKPEKDAGKEAMKMYKRKNQEFKGVLASTAMLHIKKEWKM